MPNRIVRISLAAVLTGTVALGAGCASGESDPSRVGSTERALGHVHGLGVDPADGTLYAASHFGVFRLLEGVPPERVADRWQDTMAFTVVGPN